MTQVTARHVWAWGAAAVLYAVAIFIGSSIPQPSIPEIVLSVSDKVLHVTEYGIFGLLLHRALRAQPRWPAVARHAVAVGLAIAMCYAASDEFHQHFVPGRTMDVFDWIADAIGAGVGTITSTVVIPWCTMRLHHSS